MATSPAVMTYTSLVESVPEYLERANDGRMADELPRLVALAENRIATDLKTLGIQQVATSTLVANVATLAKPTYWRDTVSLTITLTDGSLKTLFLRSYEFCRAYAPQVTDTDVPVYYADYDYEHFLLAPTPDEAYDFELLYHPRITPLSDSQQVNWLTDSAPQLLLAAVLHEAELWLKNYERAGVWDGKYTAYLDALIGENGRRAADRTGVGR